MADTISSSCPVLPDPRGYGFSQNQEDYINAFRLELLRLIRNLKTDQDIITRYSTNYIHLPIENMFTKWPLARLPIITTTNGTAVGLWAQPAPNLSYLRLARIFAGDSVNLGTIASNEWHCNFQLPANYVSGTKLTVYFYNRCVLIDTDYPANVHTIDMEAFRNRPTEGRLDFGYRTIPGNDASWAETDLCLTDIQQTTEYSNNTSEFTRVGFVVDGLNTTTPLQPGDIVQVVFYSVVEASLLNKNATHYFANFYVAYSGG